MWPDHLTRPPRAAPPLRPRLPALHAAGRGAGRSCGERDPRRLQGWPPFLAVVLGKVALDHRKVEGLEDRVLWLARKQESKAVANQLLDRPAFGPPLEVVCGHANHVVARRAALRDSNLTPVSLPLRGATHLHRHRP